MAPNIDSLNKADLYKIVANNKGLSSSQAAKKPEYLTKDGSIYDAPYPQSASSYINSLDDLKNLNVSSLSKKECEEILEQVDKYPKWILGNTINSKLEEVTKRKNELSLSESQQNLQNIASGTSTEKNSQSDPSAVSDKQKQQEEQDYSNISASEGRAMAKDAENQQVKAKEGKKEAQRYEKEANQYSKEAVKTQKELVKSQKSLDKQIKQHSKTVEKNQTQILKLSEQINSDQEEVNTLQAELQSLMAGDNTGVGTSSAFSLKLAGEVQQEQQDGKVSSNPDQQRIAELQDRISTKTTSMTKTGVQIGKLQTSTNKTLKTMHKVSMSQANYYAKTQKTLETHQSGAEKAVKIATDIESVSQTVATVGSTVKTAGRALIALGHMSLWSFGAGSALIAAGKVMSKVGTVTEMVGNYGVAAANVTKTAAYADQGNLAGALTSAGSAIMSGAQAIKTSTTLNETFAEIDKQAEEATQKLAENVTKAEAMKEMKQKGLGNLSKKQAATLAEASAAAQFENMSTEEIKNAFSNGATGGIADKAKADAIKTIESAKEVTANMTKEQIAQGINNGTIAVTSTSTVEVLEVAKEVTKEKKSNILSFDNAMKVGQGLQSAAAKFNTQQPQNSRTAQRNSGPAPHVLTNPREFMRRFG